MCSRVREPICFLRLGASVCEVRASRFYPVSIMPICNVPNCGTPTHGRSYCCSKHKQNAQRHGHPEQTSVTVQELAQYRKTVKKRIKLNAANPIWGHLEANWQAAVGHSRAAIAEAGTGASFNRYELRVHREVVKLADNVNTVDIMETILALYTLQEFKPKRFLSDGAFRFALVWRVTRLTDINVTECWNSSTGKVGRVYRNMPPRAVRLLADLIQLVFAVAALAVAQLEFEAIDRAKASQLEVHSALEALV